MEHDGDSVKVRFNWFTLYFRYNTTDTYFGTRFYTIDFSGAEPVIMKKKVVSRTTTSTTWWTST